MEEALEVMAEMEEEGDKAEEAPAEEEDAKAAWLARLDQPSWMGKGGAAAEPVAAE